MSRPIIATLLLIGIGGQAAAADLTLKRVMLSSAGVGYFEYAADVTGDETLGLDVPLGQVDDILKSLVVFDSAGGVAGVELPGRDNIVNAFGDAPFGPEALESPSAYLNALRGTEVTVQGPRPMAGKLLRAEPVTETDGKIATQRTRVTLLGGDGLRQFVLEDADSVQVTDPVLRSRVERALESLRRDASLTTRHLMIRVKGAGKRTVAVGYVAGAPLWKATYRLMLPASPSPTARLQGWATLENQSGADWKGVTMSLQYGSPVTFRQSLYRSYYVQRPEVPVEILGRILPDIDTRARAVTVTGSRAGGSGEAMKSADLAEGATRGMRGRAAEAPAPPAMMAAAADEVIAEETGEETIFTLSQPVDLASGHTANVPILDRDIPASRVGLVPFRRPHPLAAVRVRNNEARGLPAGVLTLYDSTGATSFAGDARLGGLPAGETRLLSFAQDLRTAVETKVSAEADVMSVLTVADGVMTYMTRSRQLVRITATSPPREARDLLLEIRRADPDQTLTFEDDKIKVTEQTATAFRVALALAAGTSRTVTAWLDQPIRQSISLEDGDDTILRAIVGQDKLPPAARAAFNRLLDLRREESRREAEVERLRKQLADVHTDEERIRKNLGSVSSADPLRARLTRALDADETKIEQLQKLIDAGLVEMEKAHRALADAATALKL